uniref:Uncharacterized protein n=1 Tax=Eutreptiella gymnastica TaxID=73025 RepID=A0A7S4G8S0_9EUGL
MWSCRCADMQSMWTAKQKVPICAAWLYKTALQNKNNIDADIFEIEAPSSARFCNSLLARYALLQQVSSHPKSVRMLECGITYVTNIFGGARALNKAGTPAIPYELLPRS